MKKYEIPPLPKWNPTTVLDEYFGDPQRQSSYSDGQISVETYVCPHCGALQWTGIWRKFRKERCKKCRGLLETDNEEEFINDWEEYWKSNVYGQPEKILKSGEVAGIVAFPSDIVIEKDDKKEHFIRVLGIYPCLDSNKDITNNCVFEVEDEYENNLTITKGEIFIYNIDSPCSIQARIKYEELIDVVNINIK